MLPRVSWGPLQLFKGSLIERLTDLLKSDSLTLSAREIQTRVHGGASSTLTLKKNLHLALNLKPDTFL